MPNFEELVLPHLDAAYNLARWLTRNTQDAEDAVQESYFRAFRFFAGFRGGDARAWLLKIVRNTCYTHLRKNRAHEPAALFNEQVHTDTAESQNPETLLLGKARSELLRQALEELPAPFREVLVLLEVEGLSYKEIAELLDIRAGTVMSRLARARHRLRESLSRGLSNGNARESESARRASRGERETQQDSQAIAGEIPEGEFTNEDSGLPG